MASLLITYLHIANTIVVKQSYYILLKTGKTAWTKIIW